MSKGLDNANPIIYGIDSDRIISQDEEDDNVVDKIDDREVFGR